MKKSTKIISALLVLVMMMAQVVCVNAAVSANFTISAQQTDHYEKTITVNVTNGSKVSYVLIEEFDKDGNLVAQEGSGFSGSSTFGLTVKVRPNDVSKLKVTVLEGTEEKTKEYNVGGNSYYNPGSSSSSTSTGTYDGLKSSSSSSNGNYYYSNGSNVWDYYDPDKWYGYYEDKEDKEVKDYDYYYVTCRSLNVRNGAGTWADKVGSLKRYDMVKVYSIEKDWAVIEYNGRLRYVSARYIDEY